MSIEARLTIAAKKVIGLIACTLLLLYTLLVLFPSYWAGLSSTTADTTSREVPIYGNRGSVNDDALMTLPVYLSLLVWYLVPVLLLVYGSLVIHSRSQLSKRRFGLSLLFLVAVLLLIYITYPAADSLLSYVIDW
ncbi:hypothetical protein HC891_28165 [Candidatus Gracilibacteria bacterium]|nr:hypothetical protein [Candidatus Gracilibacteria bacterium]